MDPILLNRLANLKITTIERNDAARSYILDLLDWVGKFKSIDAAKYCKSRDESEIALKLASISFSTETELANLFKNDSQIRIIRMSSYPHLYLAETSDIDFGIVVNNLTT